MNNNDNMLEAFPVASDDYFNVCVYSNEAGLHFVRYRSSKTYKDPMGINTSISLGKCKDGHGLSLKVANTASSSTFHLDNIETVRVLNRDILVDPSLRWIGLYFINKDTVTLLVTHRFGCVLSYILDSKRSFEEAERKFYGLYKVKTKATEPKITDAD